MAKTIVPIKYVLGILTAELICVFLLIVSFNKALVKYARDSTNVLKVLNVSLKMEFVSLLVRYGMSLHVKIFNFALKQDFVLTSLVCLMKIVEIANASITYVIKLQSTI